MAKFGISVIKYEGDNSSFVWKHPVEDFNLGSQLIVHESQEAIFLYQGKAHAPFGPGRYTLTTENIPFIRNIIEKFTGNNSPFHAEVYFINKTVQMGFKWGTDSRVRFIEPNTGIPLDIGASGEMSLEVTDSVKLLTKLVGTTGGLTRSQIASVTDENGWSQILKGVFRPIILTSVKTYLASVIKEQRLNILEIDEKLSMLSEGLREKVSEGFEEFGLKVPQFYVTNVSLPEEDRNFKRIRALISESYLGVKEAEVEADILAARRRVTVEEETTLTERARFEAERIRIQAQAEADKRRYEGFADAEVMAAMGYNHKDELNAEVQKAYAEGLGNMVGGNGGVASELLGLGVGMAAMNNMSGQISDAMKGLNGESVSKEEAKAEEWTCACGHSQNTGKFCSECGKEKPEVWDCPNCGAKGIKGKFCSECGTQKPEVWNCPNCGARDIKGKFCSECGQAKA